MMRSVIGISCGQQRKNSEIILRKEYALRIYQAGGLPLIIPVSPDRAFIDELFQRCDGLLLTGGGDLNPESYRGKAGVHFSRNIDEERDSYEQYLLELAQTKNRPVLAICRGMQLVNIYCGGTLFQDIEAEIPGILRHQPFPGARTAEHGVRNREGTKINLLMGEKLEVNSNHHQAVKKVGSGLIASAFSDDGIVEAIEANGSWWMVGVQWHPERLTGRLAMPELFTAFTQAAAAYT
jgi:putative glutamine amidotransferase